jgi:NTP pyrophosphatase (non-canonical NTP hydrolase)
VHDRLRLTHRSIDLVLRERDQQDDRWGVQRHSWPEWMSILTEEVGEAAQAANNEYFHPSGDLSRLKEELVQVASVAIAMVEHIEELEAQE